MLLSLRALPAGRPLTRLRAVRFSSHDAPQYNEPTGLLFGEKPPPPGFRRIKQPWESLWYWGMYGSMAVGVVLMYFKPDTSIQTWALKEAKRRMEERGEQYKYEPSSLTRPS
ncbi:ESSS subunit of NADH:ubiquinone oxidoreductase-domain-containing protein [Mycena rosella]|uniref:NADH dehydrogenase [ubiquinone] 1 beta subcomplex subunit 11, mitochondrial n=1 Tax=Mycena rosella TaxID=1033263 RepID=A0AAD7GVD7_MYCRO|nr:ESSS subunit of NADH:ubiquinone oxidoreductase-domain-containing protein [Mycena rosella]